MMHHVVIYIALQAWKYLPITLGRTKEQNIKIKIIDRETR